MLGSQDLRNVLDKLAQGEPAQGRRRMLHENLPGPRGRPGPGRRSTCSSRPTRAKVPEGDGVAWPRDRDVLPELLRVPPPSNWVHIRTTKPDRGSVFSTGAVCRHDKTKGERDPGTACLTMVFKLMESASKRLAIVLKTDRRCWPEVVSRDQVHRMGSGRSPPA